MDAHGVIPPHMDIKMAWSQAYGRARQLMTRPYRLLPWLMIGLMAALENTAQGPAGFSYVLSSNARSFFAAWFPLSEDARAVTGLIVEQSGLFILISLPLLMFLFFVTIFLLWIGSHVQTAFARAAETGTYSLRRNWIETSEDGHSLFLFRLTLAVLAFLMMVFMILVMSLFVQDSPTYTDSGLPMAFGPVETFLSWGGFAMGLLNELLRNLCIPIMLRLKVTCLDSLRILGRLVRRYPRPLLTYLGIKVLLTGAIWMLWVVGGIGTCGLGFLPVFHHAIFAPLYVFDRLLSMYLIQGLWPEEAADDKWEEGITSDWARVMPRPTGIA